MKNLTAAGIAGIIILGVAIIILWPLAIIWALNTLFALSIGYTFWTWLAVLVVSGAINAGRVNATKTRG